MPDDIRASLKDLPTPSYYPPGHPCHGKPPHTHPTRRASVQCDRERQRLINQAKQG